MVTESPNNSTRPRVRSPAPDSGCSSPYTPLSPGSELSPLHQGASYCLPVAGEGTQAHPLGSSPGMLRKQPRSTPLDTLPLPPWTPSYRSSFPRPFPSVPSWVLGKKQHLPGYSSGVQFLPSQQDQPEALTPICVFQTAPFSSAQRGTVKFFPLPLQPLKLQSSGSGQSTSSPRLHCS